MWQNQKECFRLFINLWNRKQIVFDWFRKKGQKKIYIRTLEILWRPGAIQNYTHRAAYGVKVFADCKDVRGWTRSDGSES